MDDLIARLDAWLQANRPDYYAALQTGLSEAQLAEWEAAIQTPLPDDFKAVYCWRNGQSETEYSDLYHNYMWIGSGEIISNWNVMKELLDAGDFEVANWWHPRWIPFGHNGGGDLLCLDLNGSFDGIPGQIVQFWHDWENRTIEAGSFRDWFSLLVNGLESGVLAPTQYMASAPEHGTFIGETDKAAFARLRERWTPGYPKDAEAGGSN